jgi:hypothetical protein
MYELDVCTITWVVQSLRNQNKCVARTYVRAKANGDEPLSSRSLTHWIARAADKHWVLRDDGRQRRCGRGLLGATAAQAEAAPAALASDRQPSQCLLGS